MKPIIGVTPLFDEEKDSIWMLPGYMDGIRMAGGVPIILPLEASDEDLNQIFKLCDGFLLTGGQDVHPKYYGETVSEEYGNSNEKRDELELKIFQRAYAADKPIFGICRGFHLINVALGGTLFQDLPSQFRNGAIIKHQMKSPYNRSIHTIQIEKNSRLYRLLETKIIGVNSYHHQGIKILGKGLEIMAIAPDGLIEAISSQSKRFVWGVQWHPEFLFASDDPSKKIFKEFIASMKTDLKEIHNDERSA